MSKGIFICGTDTGVGKTVITGLIAKQLQKKGKKVVTQKWVQTGCKGFPKDIAIHLKLMGKPKSYVKDILDFVCPYCFDFPASPHLASRLNGKRLTVNGKRLKNAYQELAKRFNHVVVEGSGGALVPLNEKLLQLDLVKQLNLPVILVVGNKLGAINHALLTVEAIKKRNIKLVGLVFNDMKGKDKILKNNVAIIKKLSGAKVIASLKRYSRVSGLLRAGVRVLT